ncbi:hypothetical protein PENTCL1PPCAC_3129, partial [Pristionchus entomophagus]
WYMILEERRKTKELRGFSKSFSYAEDHFKALRLQWEIIEIVRQNRPRTSRKVREPRYFFRGEGVLWSPSID